MIYFVIYYSKYSGLFHKLRRLDVLEKTETYEQEMIDFQRMVTWKKINKMQRVSYFPTLGIAILHLLSFYSFWNREVFTQYYLSVIYILIGALIFILLANKTQGSRVLRRGPDSGSNSGPWI